jgi:hypothetical protein
VKRNLSIDAPAARSGDRLRAHGSQGRLPAIPDALRQGLPACSRRSDPDLTRGGLAGLFNKSLKTIYRWEELYGFSPVRKNSRVLRYELDSVVSLVACGRELNAEEAGRLGLNPTAILALAASMAARPETVPDTNAVQPVVLANEGEDYRRLLMVWNDARIGPVLRKFVRALTEETVTAIN